MKNQLSNMLLAGVIASTFLMVNCQKAPSKSVKADNANQNAKTDDTSVMADACTDEALAALNSRKAAYDALKAEYTAVEPTMFKNGVLIPGANIDSETEQKIKNGQASLNSAQEAVEAAIGAIKTPSGLVANGCVDTKTLDPKTQKPANTPNAISVLQIENKKLLDATSILLLHVAGKTSDESSGDGTTVDGSSGEEPKKEDPKVSIEDEAKKAKAGSSDSSAASEDGSLASEDATAGSSDSSSAASGDSSAASSDATSASEDATPAEML
jgi:hypothetical protein